MMNYRKNFDETSVLTDERRENIMKLSEWNEIISYAKELCQKRTSNIRPITYSMYDGRKEFILHYMIVKANYTIELQAGCMTQ